MQNMEGVHQFPNSRAGNKPWRACMEGVLIWRVLEWRVDCTNSGMRERKVNALA